MLLSVFGSSSKGNAYALTDESGHTLLIECGVPFKKIAEHLNYDTTNVHAVLVSHEHGDHAKYVDQYMDAGIKVYCNAHTMIRWTKKKIRPHHWSDLCEGLTFHLGPFQVMPFDVQHDVPCFGFMIEHVEMGNVVFMTDTYYTKYKFREVRNWIIECNYDQDVLDQKAREKQTHVFLRNRVRSSHFSLQNMIKMLEANDTSITNKIVLVHLSDTNSDEKKMIQAVEKLIGITPVIADPGVSVELNKRPF